MGEEVAKKVSDDVEEKVAEKVTDDVEEKVTENVEASMSKEIAENVEGLLSEEVESIIRQLEEVNDRIERRPSREEIRADLAEEGASGERPGESGNE